MVQALKNENQNPPQNLDTSNEHIPFLKKSIPMPAHVNKHTMSLAKQEILRILSDVPCLTRDKLLEQLQEKYVIQDRALRTIKESMIRDEHIPVGGYRHKKTSELKGYALIRTREQLKEAAWEYVEKIQGCVEMINHLYVAFFIYHKIQQETPPQLTLLDVIEMQEAAANGK
jgi:hypothetical protein